MAITVTFRDDLAELEQADASTLADVSARIAARSG